MKTLTSLILLFISFSSFAGTARNFICKSDYEVVYASVEVKSQDDYSVKLRTEYSEIDVWSEWVLFDEKGEMRSIQTSGGVENFHIQKAADGKWAGEYWYDNSLSVLKCIHD